MPVAVPPGLRAHLDHRGEKVGAKIRDAQLEKIPVMLVVGAKEAEANSVSYRDRIDCHSGEDQLPVRQHAVHHAGSSGSSHKDLRQQRVQLLGEARQL